MKQYKYEVLVTLVEGKDFTQDEMLNQVVKALIQEVGFMVSDIKVNQTGILVNDAVEE